MRQQKEQMKRDIIKMLIGILLGAQVQEGYSKPEITMEKGNASQAGFSVEEQNRLADGRYVYKVALTGTQKK
mgnify:CR=1 FL=1